MVAGAASLEAGRWTVRSLVFEGSIAAGCFGRARAVEAVFDAGGLVDDVVEVFAGDVAAGPASAAGEVFVGGVVETFGVEVEREPELAGLTVDDIVGEVVET